MHSRKILRTMSWASRAVLSVVLVVLCSQPAAGATESAVDWPLWGYDAARSGATPMEIPEELHLNWARRLATPRPAWPRQLDDMGKLDFDLSYAPVVMGDLVFVPSMVSDRVTAYRVGDGSEVWRCYVDGPVRLAPAAWEGKVYFVSDDGHLYCVDARSGEQLWCFKAAPAERLVLGNNRVISMWAARGGPVLKDGRVYFAAGVWPFMGTFVYALDAGTGAVVWQNTGESSTWQHQPHGGAFAFAGISPQGYLAATEDRLVVSGGRSTPALLDRHTGEFLHLNLYKKRSGGYRVRADDEFFYNHGIRYSLHDGHKVGGASLVNEALQARAREFADRIDGPVFTALTAQGRLFLTTTEGTLYCFGPDAPDEPRVYNDRAARAKAQPVARAPSGEREAAILRHAEAIGSGYALFLGVGDGDLMEQVAVHTQLHVVGIDPDREKIGALRRRFDEAGLYGTRIGLLPGRAADMKYPPYISSLIVVEDPAAGGLKQQDVYGLLRPYGGKAFFGADVVLSREGPLPGAGQWTHQYADPAQTTVSQDDRVRLPLGVLWYGSVSHNNVLPRHAGGPRPQVAGGRLVILGVERVSARDVYTGREIWAREFPGIGHPCTNLELEERWRRGSGVYMDRIPGATYIGSPYVTLPDSIYLRHRGQVFRLDPETGETLAEFSLYREGVEVPPNDWGHISVWEDLLICTADPHQFDETRLGWTDNWNATSSRRLVVMDRFTGETLYTRRAEIGFRHNAIVAAEGRIMVIDGLSEQPLQFLRSRRARPQERPRVMALDAADGRVLWETGSDVSGTFLAYSEKHDILLEGGSVDGRYRLPDEPYSRAIARRGSTGEVLWSGPMQFPAVVLRDMLIPPRPGDMRDIKTGEPVRRLHPITGRKIKQRYWKSYGCGASNGSPHMLLFRSGAAGFGDLEHGGGTGNFGGFKSGCTASLIAADGVLNAPDYTRTCTCSYQNQTSLGLVHMPAVEVWTGVAVDRGEGPVRRLGINLGAPGCRRAENGTLWVPYPRTGSPAPDLPVLVNTVDFADTSVRVVDVSASRGSLPDKTLDGNFPSRWGMRDGREGCFDEWILYELNRPAMIDGLQMDWTGPEATRLTIETSLDGEEWATVLEKESRGRETRRETCEFRPVRARLVRLSFGEHGEGGEDDSERRPVVSASVSEVRIGGLAYPDAYAHFRSAAYRQHSAWVDGTSGLSWVAASGVMGLRYLRLSDVNGGGEPYTVTLHFAEPEGLPAGRRVFDIYLQGTLAAKSFDVAAQAGGPGRAVTRTFRGVSLDDSLVIELKQVPESRNPPFLCGVELVRQE